ncbi:hypothetical protein cypCar_00018080 [Cyprinus carpio]|nr:hypothetical protein cypCar_00018080 [Cyprinus carpio]
MTLTVSQGEGLTVITVTSNPKSKWPVLCQILGFLCYSPVCFVSQGMKGKLKDVHTALGIVQMIIGVLNIVAGIVLQCLGSWFTMGRIAQGPFWLGSMMILGGLDIMMIVLSVLQICVTISFCVVTGKALRKEDEDVKSRRFGHCYLLRTTSVQHCSMTLTVSRGEGLTVITVTSNPKSKWPVLCQILGFLCCSPVSSLSHDMKGKLKDVHTAFGIFFRGLDIMMIVLSVLQIYVTISFCVVTGKALRKENEDVKRCSMTLTVSRGEGLTVISNPKSKWPVPCQILGFLYSPVCLVSQGIKKGKLEDVHTALGIVQMITGVLSIAVGFVFTCLGPWFTLDRIAQAPFWLGSVLLVVGIICILAARFPSFCLVTIGMILNIVSAALAITAVVLCSMDLANNHAEYCESHSSYYYSHYGYDYRTPSSEISRGQDICQYYRNLIETYVTISFCVVTGKALCKKDEDVKSVEDPELHKLLLEDDTPGAA